MARIAGIDIPREKRVEISLTYIYGIGLPTSQKVLAQANVNPDTRVRDLTDEQVSQIETFLATLSGVIDPAYVAAPEALESGPDTPAPDPS